MPSTFSQRPQARGRRRARQHRRRRSAARSRPRASRSSAEASPLIVCGFVGFTFVGARSDVAKKRDALERDPAAGRRGPGPGRRGAAAVAAASRPPTAALPADLKAQLDAFNMVASRADPVGSAAQRRLARASPQGSWLSSLDAPGRARAPIADDADRRRRRTPPRPSHADRLRRLRLRALAAGGRGCCSSSRSCRCSPTSRCSGASGRTSAPTRPSSSRSARTCAWTERADEPPGRPQDARPHPRRVSSPCSGIGGWFGLVGSQRSSASSLEAQVADAQVEPRRAEDSRPNRPRTRRTGSKAKAQAKAAKAKADAKASQAAQLQAAFPTARRDAVDPAPGAEARDAVERQPRVVRARDADAGQRLRLDPDRRHGHRPLPGDPALRPRPPRAGRLGARAACTPPDGCSRSRPWGSPRRPTGLPALNATILLDAFVYSGVVPATAATADATDGSRRPPPPRQKGPPR